MKLPVKPKDSWEIVDKDGVHICLVHSTEQRDEIVAAINSHKKLLQALEEIEAVSCGERQVESDGVYDDGDGLLWIYKRIQALKEEKPK